MEQIIGKQRLDVLRDTGVIKVIPLAYMRGLTLTNTCVILDEAQNTLPIQIKTFLTRIGQGSKFIVNGDLLQTDIHHENGLEDSIKRLVGVRGLGMSRFTSEDIVRHRIVADVLSRYSDDWKVSHDSAEATMSNYIENGQAFAIKVQKKILKHYN
jgi:phosphate starvation-inducible PhoH-like protein